MSGAGQVNLAVLELDLRAHRGRPVADVLFYLGGAVVAVSLLLMVIGPWIVPFDVGRDGPALAGRPDDAGF